MRELEQDEYECIKCSSVWEFCPEDYEEWNYPLICPFCDMSIWQAITELYKGGGIREVIGWLKDRYL